MRFEFERRFERAGQSVSETYQLENKTHEDNDTAKQSSNFSKFCFFHLSVVVLQQERKRVANETLTLRGASAVFKDCLKPFNVQSSTLCR